MKFGVEVVRKIFRAKAILLKMKSSKTIIYLGGKEIVTLFSAFIEVNV